MIENLERMEIYILYKGVFWVIENKIVSEKKPCDELGNLIPDENERSQEEVWSNNHKKIWSELPRMVTRGKAYNYFPRGRVEIRKKKAIIFLNPCICHDRIIPKIKAEFGLNKNESLYDILVKADGSRHYKCYCEENE